jgi:hypothetical protein
MDLDRIFYTLAALFGIAAVVYFAWEYIEVLPRITKAILLFGLAIIVFLVADALRSHEDDASPRVSTATKAGKSNGARKARRKVRA